MKKPTLRFRQVFEHPTHFKVTRPLGNPITIAKQGLSPNLMGRLRKFAREGEVLEPTEQDQANLDELMAGSGGDSPRPRPRRLLVGDKVAGKEDVSSDVLPALPEPTIPQSFRSTVMQDAARIEDQAERAQFIKDRIDEYRAAASAEPTLLTVQSQPFPEVVRADQVEQAPVSMMGVPAMGPPSPRITQPESLKPVATEPVAEAAPKARPRPARPGVTAEAAEPTAETVAAEAPAAAVSGVQADVAATPVAPAVAPSVATSELVLPKEFDVGKPLTVEAYRAAKDANKGRSDQEIALGLIRQYAPNAEPPPDFDKLLTPPPEGASEDTLKKFDAAKDDLARAIVNQAKVDYDTNKQLLVANERAQSQRLINAEKDRATADALVARRDALAKAVEGGFKPESLYGGNLAAQIGSALSVAAGAFASGMTKMPNFALKIYESAVDRDLEVQKAKYNSLVNQYNRLLGDADDAEKLARADLNDLAALHVEGIKASSKMRGVAPAADQMIADLRAKATKEREEVALKQAQAREADVKADMAQELLNAEVNRRNASADKSRASAKVTSAGKPEKPPAPGKELPERGESGLDLFYRLNAIEQGKRIFNVKNPNTGKIVEIAASSVPAKTEAQNQLTYRQSALEQADRVLDLLKTKPNMLSVNEMKQVQTALTRFLTDYPASSGAKRILPRTDKDIVMNAVFDNPVPYARYANLFDNTRVAMEEFKRSIKEGINDVVAHYGIEGHPGKVAFMHGASTTPSNMVRIRLKNGTETNIPKENLEAAKQRLGKMFDSVVQ